MVNSEYIPLTPMNKKVLSWVLFFSLAGIWGSSFILMKRGLESFSSQQVAAIRIFVAFVFLVPIAFKHIRKEHLKHWKAFAIMGLFGNLIPAFLFTESETVISSALAGMLNSLTPLFTLLLGFLFYGSKPERKQVLGISFGFIGAIGLVYDPAGMNDSGNALWYALMVVAATLCYGISVNNIKKYLQEVSPVTATVWSMSFIGPIAGVYLFSSTDFVSRIATVPHAWTSFGYICILGVVGTSISVILFNILIRQTGALFASSVTYLIPVAAILWGLADKETVIPSHLLWISVILGGVYLVNRKPSALISLQEEKKPSSLPSPAGEGGQSL